MDELIRQAFDIIRGMWRRRWIGVAVAWVVGVAGLLALSKVPDRYEATARVYVDTTTVLMPLLAGLAVEPDINQQVGMLARTLITRPNVEKMVADADLTDASPTQADKSRLVDQIIKDLRFSSAGRDNVFNVSYRDTDGAQAQRVVQALVSMFVETGLGSKRRDTQTTRKFIDEQIEVYEKRLQEAENRLKEFRLHNLSMTTIGGGAGGQDYVTRTAIAAEELARARMELRVAEQSRDALKRELAGEEPSLLGPEVIAPVVLAPGSAELEARIDVQARLLDELLRRFTEQHPDVAQTRRMIASLEEQRRQEQKRQEEARRKIAAASAVTRQAATNPVFQQIRISLTEAEASVAAQSARLAEMQARFDQLRAAATRVPQVEAELTQLNRDYDVIRQSYQQLVARREAAALTGEIDESAGLAEFRIIDPPRVGERPVFPSRMQMVPLLLLAALAAGGAAALAAAQMMPTFHGTRALRQIGKRPVLGSLSLRPDASLLRRQRISVAGFAGSVVGLIAVYGAWLAWIALMARP